MNRKILDELWGEIVAAADARAIEEAKRNPEAHKLSLRFVSSSRYLYFKAGKDGRGREVRFCYSTHRNIAGYFLTWREIVGKNGGHRDHWSAKKVRKVARAMAAKRRDAWIIREERRDFAKLGAALGAEPVNHPAEEASQ